MAAPVGSNCRSFQRASEDLSLPPCAFKASTLTGHPVQVRGCAGSIGKLSSTPMPPSAFSFSNGEKAAVSRAPCGVRAERGARRKKVLCLTPWDVWVLDQGNLSSSVLLIDPRFVGLAPLARSGETPLIARIQTNIASLRPSLADRTGPSTAGILISKSLKPAQFPSTAKRMRPTLFIAVRARSGVVGRMVAAKGLHGQQVVGKRCPKRVV